MLTGMDPHDITAGEGQTHLHCKFDDDDWKTRCCTKTIDTEIKLNSRKMWPAECTDKDKFPYPKLDKL